jgi:hypothetical protein
MGLPPADFKVDESRPGCSWKLPGGPFLSPHYGCKGMSVVLLVTGSCYLIPPILWDFLWDPTQQTLSHTARHPSGRRPVFASRSRIRARQSVPFARRWLRMPTRMWRQPRAHAGTGLQ